MAKVEYEIQAAADEGRYILWHRSGDGDWAPAFSALSADEVFAKVRQTQLEAGMQSVAIQIRGWDVPGGPELLERLAAKADRRA